MLQLMMKTDGYILIFAMATPHVLICREALQMMKEAERMIHSCLHPYMYLSSTWRRS